jgi:transposase-like protein
VEAALAEALGEEASVLRSTVSRICTEIGTEMTEWQ